MGDIRKLLILCLAAMRLALCGGASPRVLFYEGSLDPVHNRFMRTLANEMKGNYTVSFLTSSTHAGKGSPYVFQSPFTSEDVSSMYTSMASWGNMGDAKPPSSRDEMRCTGRASDICSETPRELTLANIALANCQGLLRDEGALAAIKAKQFDFYVANPSDLCSVVLAQYLAIPYAFAVPTAIETGRQDVWVQLPSPSAYVPHHSTGFDDDMTLPQRIVNTLVSTFVTFFDEKSVRRPFEDLKTRFGIRPDQDLREAMLWTEIWLFNVHFTFDFPRPLMPNLVPVGGLVTRKAKVLSEKWRQIMDNSSTSGVVLVSFGALIDMSQLPEISELLARAFARIPQTVVWQYRGEPPAGLGVNTVLVDAFPQNDLLAHPKVRAYVTEGGTSSLHEAIYHARPIVVLPFFLDQCLNSKVVQSRVIGRRVLQHELSEQKVFAALVTAMTDPKIKATMNELSYAFRDNFRHPLKAAGLWLSHVIKFSGEHLRPIVHELYTFQYYLVDVILFLLCLVMIPVVLLFFMVRCLCRCALRAPRSVIGMLYTQKEKGD